MEVISENKPQPRYAGFWLRFVAYIIDRLVVSVAGFILAVPIIIAIVAFALGFDNIHNSEDFLNFENWQTIGWIVGLVILFALFNLLMQWLYYALMESSKQGGTLGKMALGIKITDMEGNRISFGRATARYFSRIITNMTLLIGYIIAGFTDKKQALHDLIAGCVVILK